MLILISPAKTFASSQKTTYDKSVITEPVFVSEANKIVESSLMMSSNELKKQLKCSDKVFSQSVRYMKDFFCGKNIIDHPAFLTYSGMVFKMLNATDFSSSDWSWAKDHVLITSFVYGLLAPSDGIKAYRMEGMAHIPLLTDGTVFDFWKELLTEYFIDKIKSKGNGVLLFLASQEMKQLFDWDKVSQQVRVIEPMFDTITDACQVKQIVIYTKMCRGLMLREIIKSKITNVDIIKNISPMGFHFSPDDSRENIWQYYLRK